ncbi:MAG: phage tail tape measure protein [Flammeovirgaceae bacterium]
MALKTDEVKVTLTVNSKQAVNQMGKLEMEASELRQTIKGLKKGTTEYVAANDRLKEVKVKMADLRKELGTAGMTLRQLRRLQRDLNREFSNITKGTQRYQELRQQIQEVNGEISKQRKELKEGNSAWSKLGGVLKKFGLLAIVLSQIQNLIHKLSPLSDALADVRKTTGLTQQQVVSLNESLKNIDTRTSRKELLELAEIAGKLGVEGQKNIEGFVKAADKIVVALGEDLGGDAEQTIKQVGKLVDTFKVKEKFGLEESLLKVGSAINSLGAASTASETYLVDFTKRLGGVAPNANISIQNVLGMAATLDQLGQTSETSATAMGQLLVALGQDIPGFAQIAGVSVAEFSQMLEQDANGALIKVIAGAKSTQNGLAGMAETLNRLNIDGARAAAVVGVLSNNIDLLQEQQALATQEFENGTSILTEYALKNETLGAQLDKLKNKVSDFFMDSDLMDAIKLMVEGMNDLLTTHETFEQSLDREVSSMNALFSIIKDTNTSTAARKAAIKKLNGEYGRYLPNVLKEKDTLADIVKMQEAANRALVQNMILKNERERLEKEIQEIATSQQTLIDSHHEHQTSLNYFKERKKALEKELKLLNQKQVLDVIALQDVEKKLEGVDAEIDKLEKLIKIKNEGQQALSQMLGMDRIRRETDELLKRFGLDRDPLINEEAEEKSPNPTGTGGGGGDDDEKAKMEALLQRWYNFNKEVDRLTAERKMKLDEIDTSELERIDNEHTARVTQLKEFLKAGIVTEEEYYIQRGELDEIHLQATKDFQTRKMEELEQLRKKRNEKLLQEDAEFYEKLSQQQKLQMEKELREQQELIAAKVGLLKEFASLVGATNQLIASQGAKMGTFQKELAIFQIAIETAASIAAAIAGATKAAGEKGPAAPFLIAGYITSMVATVITAMAKAKKTLNASPPTAPTFIEENSSYQPRRLATGGFTGEGLPFTDETGHRPAGIVHDGEYVVPKWLLKDNQYVADQVALIEALRLRRGFAQGGAVSNTPAPKHNTMMPMLSDQKMDMLLGKIERLTEVIQEKQDNMQAVINYGQFEDLREFEDRISQAETDSSV